MSDNTTIPPAFDIFTQWVIAKNPDWISRRILHSLITKYEAGNKAPLFGKMRQLEDDSHFELCGIFKSMFDYMGINEEYLKWKEQPNE